MGYRRVLLDPSVRTTYDAATAWALHAHVVNVTRATGTKSAPWAAAAEAAAAIDWDAPTSVPLYTEIDCCNKDEDQHFVPLEHCRPSDVFSRNYTLRFFRQCGLLPRCQGGPGRARPNNLAYVTDQARLIDGSWDMRAVSLARCPP